jgi:hypothetical protein
VETLREELFLKQERLQEEAAVVGELSVVDDGGLTGVCGRNVDYANTDTFQKLRVLGNVSPPNLSKHGALYQLCRPTLRGTRLPRPTRRTRDRTSQGCK